MMYDRLAHGTELYGSPEEPLPPPQRDFMRTMTRAVAAIKRTPHRAAIGATPSARDEWQRRGSGNGSDDGYGSGSGDDSDAHAAAKAALSILHSGVVAVGSGNRCRTCGKCPRDFMQFVYAQAQKHAVEYRHARQAGIHVTVR